MRAFFLILTAILTGFAATAFAGAPISGSGCDQDYWDVIGARAWMEAEHDTEAAQTIVTHSQSVMDLGQFECRLNDVSSASSSLFSGNIGGALFKNLSALPIDSFEPSVINHTYKSTDGFHMSVGYIAVGPTHMKTTLKALVTSGLDSYFSSNFGASSSPLCSSMAGIWNGAKGKCSNADSSTFWTFKQEINNDPRGCETATPRSNWNTAYQKSIASDANATTAKTYVYIDADADFLNLLDPTKCNATPPIPTGVMVYSQETQSSHPDAVCSAPTCWYDSKAGQCKAASHSGEPAKDTGSGVEPPDENEE